MKYNSDIKISIIVPVYNSENYITTCINSLLNQNLDNFEIILVDLQIIVEEYARDILRKMMK